MALSPDCKYCGCTLRIVIANKQCETGCFMYLKKWLLSSFSVSCQARHAGTLPILSSPQLTFQTAAALANVEGYITSKTPIKVERAQVGTWCIPRYLVF